MAYTPYGWQNPYYPPPMQDNLMQMRQMQQPQMQSQIPQALQNPVAQSGVQWVSGEQEARNWMIAPNAARGVVGQLRTDCVSQTGRCKRQADAQSIRPCRAACKRP